MIRKIFLKEIHLSFENRWLTVFKYQNLIPKERIQNLLSEYNINTITHKITIQQYITNLTPTTNI